MSEQKKEENTFFEDWTNLMDSIQKLKKDKENPFFKNNYVQLKDVLKEAKRVCKENNFILIQKTETDDIELSSKRKDHLFKTNKWNVLVTEVIHKSGEKINSKITLPAVDKENPQKLASAITYMRRYSITNILGIEEVDDDGNEAAGNKDKKQSNLVTLIEKKIKKEDKVEELDSLKNNIKKSKKINKKDKQDLLDKIGSKKMKIKSEQEDDGIPVVEDDES